MEFREQGIAHATMHLDMGGLLEWSRFDVTDSGGITRSSRVSAMVTSRSHMPTVEGARAFSLRLTIGHSSAIVQPSVGLVLDGNLLHVRVEASDDDLVAFADSIRHVIDGHVDLSLIPKPPIFKVFIGHGGDGQWEYLSRTLRDTHGILVEAFESSERAGYSTLAVVDEMIRSSSVAVVVMTGEDHDAAGNLRARENVIHEVGFCQGALGIRNTIVVLEEGVSEPSNIAGLTQVRFSRGRLIDAEPRIIEAIQQRRQANSEAVIASGEPANGSQ
jgi:predicted nucleotide-binding protein